MMSEETARRRSRRLERLRGRGHLHDQAAIAVLDWHEVVVLVKGLRLLINGVNHDESPTPDFRRRDDFPKRIDEQLFAVPLALQ